VAFNVLVVWAKPHLRAGHYLDSLYRGIEGYRDFIESDDTVILGDFNSAAYFGEGHLRFVDMLREDFGLFSAYHEYHNLNHGDETHYTYFDRTKKGKPFHIDYCFVPQSWLRRLKRVTVGRHNEWADLSDHVPLIIEISR
jgi:endonuclease/exonuclease/phosphatase family metal-dependent hydrolase